MNLLEDLELFKNDGFLFQLNYCVSKDNIQQTLDACFKEGAGGAGIYKLYDNVGNYI